MKLNLGAGGSPIAGYDNSFDIGQGKKAHPLEVPDNSCDEIRASHILEHFSHRATLTVLTDWVRALKPGGLLKIAVPDFETIVRGYAADAPLNYQGYVCGGHVDMHDVHLAQFDFAILAQAMRRAGLAGIHKWKGVGDCSALPISLNLAGWKAPARRPKVQAVMSVPRLGFQDNMFSAFKALTPLGIEVRKTTGAFWGACLTRALEEALADGAEYILTIDYDTVFSQDTVEDLIALMLAHPEADAICAMQMHRRHPFPMMRPLQAPLGEVHIDREALDAPLYPLHTGQFGCTLIRASALVAQPKPWFHSRPAPDGGWGEGRLDDDIYFWHRWNEEGRSLYLAPRAVVGHLELQIIWPGRNFEPLHQHPSEYWERGEPAQVWQ